VETDISVFIARIDSCRVRGVFNHHTTSSSNGLYYDSELLMVLRGICNLCVGFDLPAIFFSSQPVVDNGRADCTDLFFFGIIEWYC
jgi:hypothetical protein